MGHEISLVAQSTNTTTIQHMMATRGGQQKQLFHETPHYGAPLGTMSPLCTRPLNTIPEAAMFCKGVLMRHSDVSIRRT